MKMIKPSINVKYTIECDYGSIWKDEGSFTLLNDAITEVENLRNFLPNAKFRLIRSEWEVIG